MSPALPTVSVVLPVFDGLGFLRRSLPPLLARVPEDLLEVLVIDDGSTDGSAAYAEELGARVLPSGGRLGPAAARNLGVECATGDVVLFIDADVVIHEDTVAVARRALADPEVVAVFGAYDDRPTDPGFFSRFKNLQHHAVHLRSAGQATTFWSGCGAVRRQAFLAVGGFDVAQFPQPSIEDIELGYRLRAAGGRILLDPNMLATHLKRWTLTDLIRTDVFRRALPWARLLLRRPEASDDLNVTPKERARAGLAWLIAGTAPLGLVPIVGPFLAPIPLGLLGLAMVANARLLLLFLRREGMLFAFGGALFLQVYYLYATGAYLVAWAEHRLGLGQGQT